MSADTSRIDLLLWYALLVSGEQDELYDRRLGPIHLLKYVYLADLFHARRHDGATFTGTDWSFYKFGPWSQLVHERIEPALNEIGAEKRVFSSDYEDKQDWVRWHLSDDTLLREMEDQLPLEITRGLKRDVRRFGQDTQDLLHYVYGTEPMLSAAPNEPLDFTVVRHDPPRDTTPRQPLRMDSLSHTGKKRFRERMKALRTKYRNRERRDPEMVNPAKDARYDDVYAEGMKWLDGLAGEPFREEDHVVRFSDEVWRSSARKGDDVP